MFFFSCWKINSDEINKSIDFSRSSHRLLQCLTSNNMLVANGDSGFQHFENLPISDELDRYYQYSNAALKLSEIISEFSRKDTNLKNIEIAKLLKKLTPCAQSMFNEFCIRNSNITCDRNLLSYRKINGLCNCLTKPKRGASETPFISLVPQHYNDGIQSIRKTHDFNKKLPEPRSIVNSIFSNCSTQPILINATMGAVMFGQLIAHDVSMKTTTQIKSGGPGISCCTKYNKSKLPLNQQHPDCSPIGIPPDDPKLSSINCMNGLRSQAIVSNDCGLTSRKQINLQTSFLDLSVVYGANLIRHNELRTFYDGLMKIDDNGVFQRNNIGKYILGDPRAIQTPVLALLHLLFLREHNRIARIIKNLRYNWNDESIFEEARRFVIAEYQHIVMNEWYPIFHG